MIKSIAVFLDSRRASQVRLSVALRLAVRWNAHLTGVFVNLPENAGDLPRTSESFARGPGLGDVAVHYRAAEERESTAQRQRLEGGAQHAGIGCEWRELSASASLADAMMHSRYVDLVVLPPSAPAKTNDRAMFWSSGHIVLAAGVPCVFVPEDYADERIGTRIMIGWNATPQARRAISDALVFLAGADCVTVLIIDPRIASGAHGAVPGFDIAQLLGRHGVRADVERVESQGNEKGDVLIANAKSFRADLIVAGAYGHSRVVEFVLGSTTRRILQLSPIPVLLSH